uniref:rhomboid protease n=1 Tax=Corethron hystrix TaxID=216773 RepID=A0A7S1BF73_9STRA|mmetsp:Transcript_23156/g.52911  ORF Transcript_23156/g.52911 Transcript_23156/m.52911 type:complete len:463 (+) Transcript_23156:193-1581(+)
MNPNYNYACEYDDDGTMAMSLPTAEGTVMTYNDRDIGKSGAYKDTSSNAYLSSRPNSRALKSTSRTKFSRRQEFFLEEGSSDVSDTTYQPMMPGILKNTAAKVPLNEPGTTYDWKKMNDDQTANSYLVELNQSGEDSYVGGRMKNDLVPHNSVKFGVNDGVKREPAEHSPSSKSVFSFFDGNSIGDADNGIYYVKQRLGYLSISISILQIVLFFGIILHCGVAPTNINPMCGPYPDALSQWGAKNAYLIVVKHQWWRLLTSSMLHANLVHLFCNIAIQLEMAAFFEREWGSIKWFVVYVSASCGSTIVSCAVDPDSISVISSGPILGIFGAKFAEILCRSSENSEGRQQILSEHIRMEQLNGIVCCGAFLGLFSFIPFVDWSANFGGFTVGLLVGGVLFSSSVQPYFLRFMSYFTAISLSITSVYFLTFYVLKYVEPSAGLGSICAYYQQYFWNDYTCSCER